MIATLWASGVKFLADNPVARFIVWAFLLLIGWGMLKSHLKQAGRDAERAAIAKKQAEVQLRVQERSTEIINEERHNADAALQARDRSPDFPSSDLVPDPVARIIFRD